MDKRFFINKFFPPAVFFCVLSVTSLFVTFAVASIFPLIHKTNRHAVYYPIASVGLALLLVIMVSSIVFAAIFLKKQIREAKKLFVNAELDTQIYTTELHIESNTTKQDALVKRLECRLGPATSMLEEIMSVAKQIADLEEDISSLHSDSVSRLSENQTKISEWLEQNPKKEEESLIRKKAIPRDTALHDTFRAENEQISGQNIEIRKANEEMKLSNKIRRRIECISQKIDHNPPEPKFKSKHLKNSILLLLSLDNFKTVLQNGHTTICSHLLAEENRQYRDTRSALEQKLKPLKEQFDKKSTEYNELKAKLDSENAELLIRLALANDLVSFTASSHYVTTVNDSDRGGHRTIYYDPPTYIYHNAVTLRNSLRAEKDKMYAPAYVKHSAVKSLRQKVAIVESNIATLDTEHQSTLDEANNSPVLRTIEMIGTARSSQSVQDARTAQSLLRNLELHDTLHDLKERHHKLVNYQNSYESRLDQHSRSLKRQVDNFERQSEEYLEHSSKSRAYICKETYTKRGKN